MKYFVILCFPIEGVVFDLVQIGRKCREVGALLIVDGTQSVGVMPFDVQLIQPDAVIVAAYKWVFGPYSSGFGYFGPFFDDGVPIEESWMNREGSDNFQGLCNLQPKYRPKAQRYNMGEFSQFIQCAMALAAVEKLLSWGVSAVQEYIVEISKLFEVKPL
jgi:selenocysteine lyase/cysteine desulfurase